MDKRIHFIDIARIYGLFLVYCGHFIESYMKAGSSAAAIQYKFIYSFHMPLFFILSGYIAKEYIDARNLGSHLKKLSASRLVPYAFFSLLLIFPTLWTTDFTVGLELPTANGYMKGVAATFLAGFPYFNIPTWFLICLFVTELLHYFTSPYLTNSSRILAVGFGFYLAGSILAWNAVFLKPTNMLAPHGKIYPYFMILEAFTGYAFYLVGFYLGRRKFLAGNLPLAKCLVGVVLCTVLVYLSFDLNKGMFAIPFYDAVVMLASSHGNPILFPLTAILGSIAILLLARITPKSRTLAFLGSNGLIILGLNGIFYHLINDRLAAWLLLQHSGNFWTILATGIGVGLCSLLLTVPLIFFLNSNFPQLVGKPKTKGPLLPPLVR